VEQAADEWVRHYSRPGNVVFEQPDDLLVRRVLLGRALLAMTVAQAAQLGGTPALPGSVAEVLEQLLIVQWSAKLRAVWLAGKTYRPSNN